MSIVKIILTHCTMFYSISELHVIFLISFANRIHCAEQCIKVGFKKICVDVDPCDVIKCFNSGKCSNGVCKCQDGFTGTLCETNVDECASYPCKYGTCTDKTNSYTCTCKAGYTGTNCEINIYECSSSPCKNGGKCIDGINKFSCTCPSGYEGTYCGNDINECLKTPCKNGGRCTNTNGGYICSCATGYTGTNCETNINDCATSPCKNGGKCADGVATYLCTCPAGYSGKNCTDVNECLLTADLCKNGGTCNDLTPGYSCSCVPGFTGTNCETNIGKCFEDACLNGGQCNDGTDGFICTCAKGFYGNRCNNKRLVVCEDESDTISCLNGEIIRISYANYGRTAAHGTDNCADTRDQDRNCRAPTSEDIVRGACEGKKKCTLEALHTIFGPDPCLGTYKYLEVLYTCSACPFGFYGDKCQSVCPCQTNNTVACNTSTGECSCKSGYYPGNCSQECTDMTYGQDCALQCSCDAGNSKSCNPFTGTCSCKPGYYPGDCSKKCTNMRYGQDCTLRCSCDAENSKSCDPFTGNCSCKAEWKGEKCTDAITSTSFPSALESTQTSLLSVIVGVSMGGVLLIFIIIVIICCVCRARIKKRNKPDTLPPIEYVDSKAGINMGSSLREDKQKESQKKESAIGISNPTYPDTSVKRPAPSSSLKMPLPELPTYANTTFNREATNKKDIETPNPIYEQDETEVSYENFDETKTKDKSKTDYDFIHTGELETPAYTDLADPSTYYL